MKQVTTAEAIRNYNGLLRNPLRQLGIILKYRDFR